MNKVFSKVYPSWQRRESSNREMNCGERILVFRNSSGISPGWYISMNSFLGWWIKLQRFFGGFSRRHFVKCMIKFVFSHLPRWSADVHKLREDSSECFLSHCWLRHSAVGEPGDVEKYGHHPF